MGGDGSGRWRDYIKKGVVVIAFLVLLFASEVFFTASVVASCSSSPQVENSATPRLHFYLRHSSSDVPGVIEVRASSQIRIDLIRSRRMEKSQGAVLRVSAKRESEDFVLVCETSALVTGTNETFELDLHKSDEYLWKIEVFDKDDGGLTGDVPDIVEVMLLSYKRPLVLDNVKVSPATVPTYWTSLGTMHAGSGFTRECNTTTAPVPKRGEFQEITQVALPESVGKVPLTKVVQAGRNLYLKVESKEPKSGHFTVAFFAKASSDHVFLPVCRLVAFSELSKTIAASVPWEMMVPPVNWRIEVSNPDGDASSLSDAFTLKLLRDRGTLSDAHKMRPETEFICVNKAKPKSVRTAYSEASSFAYAKGMALNFEFDDPAGHLSEAVKTITRELLFYASTTWRRVCFECTIFHLSLIRSGTHWYILDNVLQYLNVLVKDPTNPRIPFPKPSMFMRVPSPTFVHKDLAELKSVACAVSDKRFEREFSIFQVTLGCPDQEGNQNPSILNILISLQDNGTSCSNSSNIIACELGNYLVELNVRDYSFIDRDGKIIFGKGSRKVPLLHVFQHEIGHWVGLEDNVGSKEGIMAESMADSRCLDDTTVTALNDLMVGNRQPANWSGAFSYERSIPTVR